MAGAGRQNADASRCTLAGEAELPFDPAFPPNTAPNWALGTALC